MPHKPSSPFPALLTSHTHTGLKTPGRFVKAKEAVSGVQFGMSIGFGVWFFVQGLHDVSTDMWAIQGVAPSPDVASPDMQRRLTYWRTYYEWRSDEVLLKGIVAPAIYMPPWAGALFAVPAVAFVVTEVLKLVGCFTKQVGGGEGRRGPPARRPAPPHASAHSTTSPPHDLATSPPHHLTTSPPHHLTTSPPHHLTTSLTTQAPASRQIGDLAYFNLLWMVLLPLVFYDIMPLEARARECDMGGGECAQVSEGNEASERNGLPLPQNLPDPATHHPAHLPSHPPTHPPAQLVFNALHLHVLKACVQLGMLLANIVRFLSEGQGSAL